MRHAKMSADKVETLRAPRGRTAPHPKLLKYTGLCLAAAASFVLVRARYRSSVAARAKRADTLRLEPQCLKCLPSQISVFSMNILSPSLVTQQRYKYCPAKFLQWEYRLQKLTRLIGLVCADVVCLQEVEVARQEELETIMKSMGYTAVIQDRAKTKFTICNATFFRSRSTAATKEGVRDSPSVGGTDVGTNGAAEVFIANCHLEGHPWKAQERFNQMKGVLGRIERRQNEADAPMDDTRILLVGDFNSTRSEALHRYLFRGRLEGGYWEPFQRWQPVVETTEAHPFNLRDVYSEVAKFPMGFTYGRPSGSCTIDYIWASSALRVQGVLQFLNRRQQVEWQRQGIPSEQHPSDHLPLGVVVDVALAGGTEGLVEEDRLHQGSGSLGRVDLVDGTG